MSSRFSLHQRQSRLSAPLHVVRRSRHVRLHHRAGFEMPVHQGAGRQAHRPVRDVLADIGNGTRPVGELHELHRLLIARSAGHDGLISRVQRLSVPHDHEGLVLQHLGIEDAAVVGRAHDHFAIRQQLRRLRSGFPPHHLVLDGVQLAEGTVLAFGRVQRLVHLVPRNAVGHQRELEIHQRRAAHAAAPGELFQVKEIGHRLRTRTRQEIAVVGEHRGGENRSRATFVDILGGIVGFRRFAVHAVGQVGQLDKFDQALVAGQPGVRKLHIHDIPVHRAGIDLRADLR